MAALIAAAMWCPGAQAQVPSPPIASPYSGQSSRPAEQPAKEPVARGEQAASTTKLRLGPLDPAPAPTDIPHDRPVIGLALGGGGALGLTEVGVLRWFEEHHVPVDVIAGTSMGSIIGALYASGHTVDEMESLLTEDSVTSVFRIQQAYRAQSFRRREDDRDIPNGVTIGLRHGVSFRNSLLTDTGLDELLNREFLRYNDQTDFNDLPIPFRCAATDLNEGKSVTFARGSLQDAVRASASLPGVFKPFQLDGHEYVDGGILKNLPTQDVLAMHADVVLAVSIPLQPVGKGDLDSIIGVLQRAFAVGIFNNESFERTFANVVIVPNVDGFNGNDYLQTVKLAQRGYAAAEADKAQLLQYALNDQQWQAYIAKRNARIRGPVSDVLRVKVETASPDVRRIVERDFAPLVNKPIDTSAIEKLLASVRSDGRYDAEYTVGYDTSVPADARRPILLVTVKDKPNGPPFLNVGLNVAAQTGGVTRATIAATLLQQDLGGYGSELRTKVDVGFLTFGESEYYRKLGDTGFFVAPRLDLKREPFYIYSGNTRLSERQLQTGGGGVDMGWSDGRDQELRVGWQDNVTTWNTTTGADGMADYNNNSQNVRLQYVYDSQDRALVPHFGIRSTSTFGYLYDTPTSPRTLQFTTQISFAETLGQKNLFLMNMEGGTMFNNAVAQPFRFTLGGPLRLAASASDQYRGTDYFLVTPGYLRRIRSLPAPLGNSLYFGGTFEMGQMRSPDAATITREDVYLGIVAETPLGVISLAPAIGTNGERKFVFTIGRLF